MTAKRKMVPSAAPEAAARPLRVKVPKSKERALIREFGLDVTTLTEDEAEKRRNDLKTLVKMGKTRGFLTQQEISDHLPEKLIDAEVLEAIVKMLGDIGVAVYEQAPDAATLLVAGGAGTSATKKPRRPQKLRSPAWIRNSAARPIRFGCTCATWARSSC